MQLTSKQVAIPVVPQPQQYVPFVKPVTYEFRVAEFLDDNGKIEKVSLQVQVWEHDEYGSGTVREFWRDVPRARFNKDGAII